MPEVTGRAAVRPYVMPARTRSSAVARAPERPELTQVSPLDCGRRGQRTTPQAG